MNSTYTIAELPIIAGKILQKVTSKTLLFYGDMGVGKTTLIKELAFKLGVKVPVSSPTFSIVNEYVLPNDKLYHFDFYRIKEEEELYDIGIEDYLDKNHWVLIEWPNKVNKSLLPKDSAIINIKKNKNGSRTIQIIDIQ